MDNSGSKQTSQEVILRACMRMLAVKLKKNRKIERIRHIKDVESIRIYGVLDFC